jgi:hypothetical protein
MVFGGFLIRYFHFSCFVGGWNPKYDGLSFSASRTFLAANHNKHGHFADQVVRLHQDKFFACQQGKGHSTITWKVTDGVFQDIDVWPYLTRKVMRPFDQDVLIKISYLPVRGIKRFSFNYS